MRLHLLLAALFLLALPDIGAAQSRPDLAFPVECTLGDDCFLQNLVDHDRGPGALDFTCGMASYDGHKGTDIRLATRAEVARGVAVLAAAPGVVRAVRDGMADRALSDTPDVQNRECGNGVIVDHAAGWSTQYCHLRRDSVLVTPGESVVAGQPIGEIGLSGMTEFPHLHLTLRQGDTVIDPFTGAAMETAFGITEDIDPLWDEPLSGALGAIMLTGFAEAVPSYADIRKEPPRPVIARTSPALVFWVHAINLRIGDRIILQIRDPDGTLIVEDVTEMSRNRAAQYRAAGRRRPAEGWPPGLYRAFAEIERSGKPVARVRQTLTIE